MSDGNDRHYCQAQGRLPGLPEGYSPRTSNLLDS